MKKVLANFKVEYLQIMDEKGNVDEKLMPKISDKMIKKMYELMVLARKFDEKALKLQRQGRIGTYASVLGQEACQIGSSLALKDEDWIFPAFRENAAFISRNVPMHYLYLYWGGDERGSNMPGNNFPFSIPVGTHPLHAVGCAMAIKYKKEKGVCVTYFGDGATSTGDFHEAMNFAGVFKLPVVFLCQNNQFAISVRRERQTASKTIAQKAIAYGFEGIQVDGNDVFAVYKATKYAVEKARKGKGPTLLELFTYRLENHTTADDWRRYRSEEEVKKWWEKEPIKRLRIFMEKKGLWNEEYERKLIEDCEKKVEKAVKDYESFERANYEDIFKYTFENMPEELIEQKEELKASLGDKNG